MRWLAASFLLLAGVGCTYDGGGAVPPGVNTRFTFLHTADLHSRLLPFELVPNVTDENLGMHPDNVPFGGGARLGYLIRRERARADRVLHLDSGDPFQGAPIFNENLGEAELRFLALMGVDGMALGNHEFDAGVPNLVRQLSRWKSFDVLAANYEFADAQDVNKNALADNIKQYALYNVDGIRVAVIGMGDIESMSSIGEGGNSTGITPLESNETLRGLVNLLHGSVDLVVVLSHLGLTGDEQLISGYERVVWKDRMPPESWAWEIREDLQDGRALVFIPGVRDVDLILGGHLHIVLNPPKVLIDPDGREVVLAHSGGFAKYLGRLDTVLEDDLERGGKKLASYKYQVFPVDKRLAPYEDVQTNELLQPYNLALNLHLDLRRVVAYAPAELSRRPLGSGGDGGLGNLVSESMRTRRRVAAEFSITNTLGIRDNFYRGPVTLEELYNVFPFENTLTVMYLSGKEIQETLNFITDKSAERGCQSQAQVAGIAFVMNCRQVLLNSREPDLTKHKNSAQDICINGAPPYWTEVKDPNRPADCVEQDTRPDCQRVVRTCANNGRPLDPSATYRVAVNDYIAAGGSGFRVLKLNTTKFNTGVSLRDALNDFMAAFPACGLVEAENGKYCPAAAVCDLQPPVAEPEVAACAEARARCSQSSCNKADAFAAQTCNDVIDCGRYVAAMITPENCRTGGPAKLPALCRDVIDGECKVVRNLKGPYADVGCVVSPEDGRIGRQTSEDLDTLPDTPDDPEEEQ